MTKCKVCRAAVAQSGVAMFEHLITRHGVELLRDPGRLVRMAQDPATQRAMARDLGQQLLGKAAGALLSAGGKHAKKS